MHDLIRQFIRFAVVGTVAWLVDYGLLMLLSQAWGVNPVLAGGISYVLSTFLNYWLSMRYVYHHREGLSRGRELTLFVALSLIGLLINELILWVGTALFGTGALAVTLVKLAASGIVALWNFFSRRHWIDADGRTGRQA